MNDAKFHEKHFQALMDNPNCPTDIKEDLRRIHSEEGIDSPRIQKVLAFLRKMALKKMLKDERADAIEQNGAEK